MSTTAKDGRAPRELKLARFLGWFSLALGAPQITRPDQVNRLIGVESDRESRRWQRIVGVREIVAWAGLVSRPWPARFAWARVVGDAKDLVLLGTAFRNKKSDRTRLTAATASVAGIAALDLYTALRMSRKPQPQQHEEKPMEAKAAITVREPLAQVFAAWENFENFPLFMNHLEAVEETGNRRSRWKAKAVGSTTVEWEAEVITLTPNEVIEWRSVGGSSVENSGVVRFKPAPGNRGTELHVEIEYDTPGGKLGDVLGKLFGGDATQKVKDDLRRFKQLMETGEIARSESTPEGTAARSYFKQRPAQPLADEDTVGAGGRNR
jgi:uncharacterized membrane protein